MNQQLKEKQEKKDIEKFKNSYYHEQIEKDKQEFAETQKSLKEKKRQMEKVNFDSITEQISQKKAKSPEMIINKFGI